MPPRAQRGTGGVRGSWHGVCYSKNRAKGVACKARAKAWHGKWNSKNRAKMRAGIKKGPWGSEWVVVGMRNACTAPTD